MMSYKTGISRLLLALIALAGILISLIVLLSGGEKSKGEPVGNVCILLEARATSTRLSCTDVKFFQVIYPAIGIDRGVLVKLIDDNGIDSSGTDRSTGKLLVPNYPLYSRIGFSALDNVYLQSEDLERLLEESKRVLTLSSDPVVKNNIERLMLIAGQAQAQGKVLRIF